MLSIWWDYKGVVYFELLPNNQTINSDVYCSQRVKLEEAIKEKRPELVNRKGIVFHHDKARPHTSLATRTRLLELGWNMMSHPPYSPDLAPSDYHLFWNLQNFLNGKNFNLMVSTEASWWNILNSLITMTSNRTWLNFLLLRIRNSIGAGSWSYQKDGKKVIEHNGRYLTD